LRIRRVSTARRAVRNDSRQLKRDYEKTEDDLKALQSVGQIIGEVLRQLDEEKFIVKASSGPRYVVGCRAKVEKAKLLKGVRVALDMTTLTIMRVLPREVDPVVYHMLNENAGDTSYSSVGGLSEQIRELREVIELPLVNPELFDRVGIKAPKGVLLYGPPGTGKTLLARAISNNIDAHFLKVVSSAIVDKYIGESARLIREMFGYAKEHQPCIIFMDEIDAIGGRRFSEGTSADREIQRTLMELLNQLDGFDALGKVKMICATNRPDVLDPALLRPGRLDRKIEIPLPNEAGRVEVLKIHANPMTKSGDIGARTRGAPSPLAPLVPLHPTCAPATSRARASILTPPRRPPRARHRLRVGGQAGRRLQRCGPAQRVHGGGHVCHPGRARLCQRGRLHEGRTQGTARRAGARAAAHARSRAAPAFLAHADLAAPG
jgi:26S proteasome regulatory subunit T4